MAVRRGQPEARPAGQVPAAGAPDPQRLTAAQSARRERIVATALAFMRRQEYEDIQMRDIAIAADVALGTLYRYFPSKEQLFGEVLVRWALSLQQRSTASPATAPITADAVAAIYDRAIDGFERHPQFFRLVHVIERSDDPAVRATYDEFRSLTDRTFRGDAAAGAGEARLESLMLRATLDILLRRWTTGDCTIEQVRADMDAAVRLVHHTR